MITLNSLIGDEAQALDQHWTGREATLWTALPGIVQSFDASALTCVVQPAIQGRHVLEDGSVEVVGLPLLLDCPVVFPHGGGCSLTFPVKAGDECLVVFADRSIALWWQSGGVQPPAEPRMHDLSDGFVLPGPWSQVTKIGSVSTSAVELRTDDRGAYVSLNPSSHAVEVKTSGTLSAESSGAATLKCPTLKIDCPATTITGNVKIQGGLSCSGGSGSATATFTGDVVADGISLKSHTHTGDSGGTTSAPK